MNKLIGYISITEEKEVGLVTPVFRKDKEKPFIIDNSRTEGFSSRTLSDKMSSYLIEEYSLKQRNIFFEDKELRPFFLFVLGDIVISEWDKNSFLLKYIEEYILINEKLDARRKKNLFLFMGFSGLAKKEYQKLNQNFDFDHKFIYKTVNTINILNYDSFILSFEVLFSKDFKKFINSGFRISHLFIFDDYISLFSYRIERTVFTEDILISSRFLEQITNRYRLEILIILCTLAKLDFGFLKNYFEKFKKFSNTYELQEFNEIIFKKSVENRFRSWEEWDVINFLSGTLAHSELNNNNNSPLFLNSLEENRIAYAEHAHEKTKKEKKLETQELALLADKLVNKALELA